MPNQSTKWQCRVADSLGGGFAGDVYNAWNVEPYTDLYAPTCFFGMYGMKDFQALWNHKGERHILFAGSDIRNLMKGYWLDKEGKEKIDPNYISFWINENCTSYVENSLEQIALDSMGIYSKVVPSFLGKVEDYPVQELRTDRERYYTSVSGDDFKLYGWDEIDDIARRNPQAEYHLYGNIKKWITTENNVVIHGRISQEEMNEQIKSMTGGLRLTRFDGFSELIAKSLLWGQTPISPYIQYPYKNRDDLLAVVNRYPWYAKNN